MAALPSIWSFLAALPAVIWSFDWTRTNPGWSSISNICFVFPSFSFWPTFSSKMVHRKNNLKLYRWTQYWMIVQLYLVRRPSWGSLRACSARRQNRKENKPSLNFEKLGDDKLDRNELRVQRRGKWNGTLVARQPITSLVWFRQPTIAKLFNHVKEERLLHQIFALFSECNHYNSGYYTFLSDRNIDT